MCTIATKQFGTLEYSGEQVIEFPQGIPGFEEETQFLLVEFDATRPLAFLQSVRSGGLCFTMLPVSFGDPDYKLKLSPHDRSVLGWTEENGTQGLCFGILCANDGTAPTMNLLGPIVIDQQRRVGVQAVRDDAVYSSQHPLFPAAAEGDAKCL